jgi:hypothetical protein
MLVPTSAFGLAGAAIRYLADEILAAKDVKRLVRAGDPIPRSKELVSTVTCDKPGVSMNGAEAGCLETGIKAEAGLLEASTEAGLFDSAAPVTTGSERRETDTQLATAATSTQPTTFSSRC